MYDLAQPNEQPGPCGKCRGTGTYSWGTFFNGKPSNTGPCFSCQGTGHQTLEQIKRNEAYNRFKIVQIARMQ
jgi:hypothetical protein